MNGREVNKGMQNDSRHSDILFFQVCYQCWTGTMGVPLARESRRQRFEHVMQLTLPPSRKLCREPHENQRVENPSREIKSNVYSISWHNARCHLNYLCGVGRRRKIRDEPERLRNERDGGENRRKEGEQNREERRINPEIPHVTRERADEKAERRNRGPSKNCCESDFEAADESYPIP